MHALAATDWNGSGPSEHHFLDCWNGSCQESDWNATGSGTSGWTGFTVSCPGTVQGQERNLNNRTSPRGYCDPIYRTDSHQLFFFSWAEICFLPCRARRPPASFFSAGPSPSLFPYYLGQVRALWSKIDIWFKIEKKMEQKGVMI
jgi:hypothetical protein